MSILANQKYYGAARLQKTYIAHHVTNEQRVNNGELPNYFVENGHPGIAPKSVFLEVQDRLQHPGRNCSSSTLFVIATELGHSDANTTQAIYTHQIARARAEPSGVRAGVFSVLREA